MFREESPQKTPALSEVFHELSVRCVFLRSESAVTTGHSPFAADGTRTTIHSPLSLQSLHPLNRPHRILITPKPGKPEIMLPLRPKPASGRSHHMGFIQQLIKKLP